MKNHSYHILLVALLFLSGASCRKFVEKQKERIANNIITDGTWRVSRYVAGDSDVTHSFQGYQFQFNENGQVDGILGSFRVTGTWNADVAAKTIVSFFPGSPLPVNRLNHTWKITDSYNDSVSANCIVDTLRLRLELHKN